MTAGLRDYDEQWIERERMANELQQRFESSRQREEEQDARLLDTAFQSEQRLLITIESALLDDDHTANLSHAAVTIARLRSRLTELTR
jgi:predicted nucleic acid-binding protein